MFDANFVNQPHIICFLVHKTSKTTSCVVPATVSTYLQAFVGSWVSVVAVRPVESVVSVVEAETEVVAAVVDCSTCFLRPAVFVKHQPQRTLIIAAVATY